MDLSLHQLKDLLQWYAQEFRDPMVLDPPQWFQSFIFCEAFIQMPFFPVAAYAFLKGRFKLNEVEETHLNASSLLVSH